MVGNCECNTERGFKNQLQYFDRFEKFGISKFSILNTKSQIEVKIEVKTEVKIEEKTEVKIEVKTEVKIEVKIEVKTEAKIEELVYSHLQLTLLTNFQFHFFPGIPKMKQLTSFLY